jgi:hypothetical protein
MANKLIYLRGYGYMEVPAELTGQELSKYATEQARKSMATSVVQAPREEEKKPEPSTMQQAAGFAAGLPAGLASGLIGSTLEGIGGLTGIRPVEEAGASFNEWVQERLKQAVGEEAAASGASQVGQTIGGIASFFTPGVAAKVLGGAGKLVKAAPYLSTAMSGIQGAGEQVERMRQQEAQGEQIDPLMRQLYAAGAGAGTALLENIPISGLAKYTPLRRVLGDIPVSAEAGAFTRAMDAGAGTILGRALGTGAGEAATEVSQNALQNIIERQYNEQRGILEGSTESAVGGFLAGAALQGGADLYRDVYLNRKKFEGDVKALRGQLSEEQLPLLPAGKRKAVQIRGKDISTVLGEEDIAEAEAAFSRVASPQGVPLLPPGKFASDEEARRKIDEEIEAAKVYGPTPDLSYATPEAMARIEELRAKEQADNEAIIKQREQDIAALPDFPSYLPDPNVTPISEWPKPQVKLFDQYLSKFSPEQTKLIESFSPEEMDSFIERGIKRKTESEQQLQKIREEQAARIAASRRADIEQADAITLSRFAEDYQKQEAEAARVKREEELSKAAAGRAEEAAIKNLYAREEFDKFVADRIAAKSKIEESQRVAAELAQTKFGKPLSELKDSQKIQLASEIDAISKEASFRTEVNKEIPELGDPIYKLQNRVAVNFFGTQYKNLPEAKQGMVNSAIERGEGRTVLGEELLEEKDFDKYKRLYNRDDFRAVNKEVRSFARDESGFIPVTKDSLYSAVKSVSEDPTSTIKPNRMASNAMFKHMLDRGVIVDIDGKTYLNEEVTGPRYQLPVSNNPNIDSQQKAFNAEEARVTVAPKMRDALERRGLSDVFTLGIVGKIDETPALGNYLNRVIQIAAAPEGKVRSIDEMVSSMDHEIVHGMRAAGLFTDAEWNLLTTDFNANLLDDKQKEEYTRIYKAQGMSDQAIQEALNEEAVAMKAAQLNNVDPKRLDPKSLSLINKVRFYLEFGRNSAALGYNSAEDVLAAIKSGEIGKRGFTSEFEKVGGKATRVGRQEISIASEADRPSGVETKVYGEEDEEGVTDEKYKQALSGLASKFDRKTPVKSPRQYLIQEMDVAPEDVDAMVKGMIKNKDLVKVGGALYISDRARKGMSTEAPAAPKATPEPAKPVPAGKLEIAPSGAERAKQDVLFNPQGPSVTKPFFTKKSAKNPLEEASDLIKGNFSSFRQKLVDRYDPVRLMAIEAYSKTGDKKYLSAAEGSYHALLFSDKAQDMALAGLEDGGFTTEGSIILAADNEKIAPLKIFQSLREKGKLDAFFNFAYAKRYKALKGNGKDPGGVISEADVEREYKRWENDDDINTAIDNFKAYNDNLVDILRKSGFISAGEAKAWKSAFYIPFYRIPTVMEGDVDTGEVDIPRLSSQITNLSNPKGLTGRDLPVNDAIENIIANTYYVIGTAAKNFAARKVARDGVVTGYMREIEKSGDAQQGYKVITVREGGAKKHYEVKDALLHDAVANSGFPVQDVLRGMGWFTEKLRRGTTLSPTYIVRNTLRDSIQSWILGQYGSTFLPPFKEITKGIQMAYKNSPEFKALKAAGIASSGLRKKTLQETAREMRRKIGEEQQGVLAKLGEIFNKGIEVLERGAEISEASTRTKVYQDVLAKTGDRKEALFAAMETINFSRKGSSRGLQIGMALLPFFNSRIQGLDVFYRTMKGEKMMPNQMSADMKNAAVTRFMYFSALSALYALYMSNHPAWENATDEEKDGNIFLPVDFIPGIKKGTVLKFPIPQELGLVSKMPAERIVTMIKGRSDGGELIDALQRAVFDTLSFNPIPQVFLPGIEAIANFDFYSQRPIENQYLASLLPEERYTEYTTGVAKAIGRATEETAVAVSPVMVDHLIRGYFGTIGAYSADILGRLIEEGSDAPAPERMRFSEPYLLPVIGPLFKSAEGKKMVEDLYMIDEAAKMAASTLKAYSENGRELSEAKEDELYQLAEIGEEVRPVIDQIRELNRQKRAIQTDTEMSSGEKRDELNEIQKEIVSLAAEVNDLKKQVPIRLRK